jgi:hypothetical protein
VHIYIYIHWGLKRKKQAKTTHTICIYTLNRKNKQKQHVSLSLSLTFLHLPNSPLGRSKNSNFFRMSSTPITSEDMLRWKASGPITSISDCSASTAAVVRTGFFSLKQTKRINYYHQFIFFLMTYICIAKIKKEEATFHSRANEYHVHKGQ